MFLPPFPITAPAFWEYREYFEKLKAQQIHANEEMWTMVLQLTGKGLRVYYKLFQEKHNDYMNTLNKEWKLII